MKKTLPSWSSLVLLSPLVAGCAVQGTVTTPPVSATVDVNGNAVAPAVDANATATTDGTQTDSYEETDPSALTDFHQTLDSHGTWVEDPTYGTVWVPNSGEVGPGYTPYSTAGHWAYDDNNDYVWVSDYDWGWAPYHYGRWVEIDGRGWSWIPGRTYRGAWVTWGADDGYGTVGWAPMPPEYVWRGGVASPYTYSGSARWSYVGRGDEFAPNVGARVMTGPAAAGIATRVHPLGNPGRGPSAAPSPQNLGLAPTQITRVGGSSTSGIARAQQFGHPSTATQLGGHPATHSLGAATIGTQGTMTGTQRPGQTTGVGGATVGTQGTMTGTQRPGQTTGVGGATVGQTATMTGTQRPGQTTGVGGATVGQTGTPPQHGPLNTGYHAVPTTETHVTPTTGQTPVQVQPQQGRKKPVVDPGPAPHTQPAGGGHGGGGGTGGAHGNPPRTK